MNPFYLLRLFIVAPLLLTACGYQRIDLYHYSLRSDVILDSESEQAVLSKAKLDWTEDRQIRVLYVSGTPYERGYQQGALLRAEIQDNLNYLYDKMLEKFPSEELFDEAFERARPFIPEEYMQEMHGLAHGAKMPLKVIHRIHILPEITEWGGKKRLKGIVKQMIRSGFKNPFETTSSRATEGVVGAQAPERRENGAFWGPHSSLERFKNGQEPIFETSSSGELQTSCSNLSAVDDATADGRQHVVRILDWGLHKISKLHQYPLLTVNVPDSGITSVNIGWAGYLGAVSGMNAKGITLGEMGYNDPPNETLRGIPMPFLLRDVLTYANDLRDVRSIIGNAQGTSSFVFLMSDGKSGDAELYVKDADRFEVYQPGVEVPDGDEILPAIKNISYGGHYNERMAELLAQYHGNITEQSLMNDIIPQIAMSSNFQNVVYRPHALSFWVSNAKGKDQPAYSQEYTFFNFGDAIGGYWRTIGKRPH